MYIEMNPTGLTLSDLICVAHRKRSEDTGFPYAVQSCRCSNCRYVSEGKCSLKECCCMAERVKAHTCTFAEILNTCFANVKDNVFHYQAAGMTDEQIAEIVMFDEEQFRNDRRYRMHTQEFCESDFDDV